ncbi:alpha/beta fold hydrolase [Pseudooctadecabacter jejudonensis]|uniref:Palmitoyl-protein thioesterase ABHD10, mitochondrial n=1 Tax=Pseudooctadecabacter jejudonensis TaxID=1391910 RepID=A0A1Y5RN69_9RHOB|nr:alpha/beta hydrolase [Pseudooctadecabacter jejudonensis]SLN21472.1 Alpha/beta hydrolase family protein [Pseudooctadecabacter jejudonensis]
MEQRMVTEQGREIAYHHTDGTGPTVVFLGGFKSDMEGTKALFLEEWARGQGRAFIRFDYSGHGVSGGEFTDGCIGDWFEDACAIIGLIKGSVVLVGSSMGGWISLLVARAMPDKVAGLVGIAAAPDFTEDGFWAGFDEVMRAKLMREGRVALPSDYGEPYIITKRLIEDGRDRLVLRDPLEVPCAVRLVQGTADTSVPVAWGTRLLEHLRCEDARLTLVKGADHSFSAPDCLPVIEQALAEVLAAADR